MSTSPSGQFPKVRLRRSRRTAALRRLVAETELGPGDLIYPVFVLEGTKRTEPVSSMPGIERKSVDGLLRELGGAAKLGIPAVALFPVIDADKKSLDGAECANPDGLVQTTVLAIKAEYPDLAVITDVALDPMIRVTCLMMRPSPCWCARPLLMPTPAQTSWRHPT